MKNKIVSTISGIALLFCSLGCSSKSLIEKSEFTLTGRILNMNSNMATIYHNDIMEISSIPINVVIEPETGSFSYILLISKGHDFVFEYNNKQIRLYAEPGGNLHIEFDANEIYFDNNEPLQSVKYTGNSAQINTEMLTYFNYKKTKTFSTECDGKNADVLLTEIKLHTEKEQAELNDFMQQNKPSQAFITWAKNHIVYSNANYQYYYFTYQFITIPKSKKGLFNPELFPVNNETSLVSKEYLDYLNNYVYYHYFRINTGNDYNLPIKLLNENEPESSIKELMKFQIIKRLLKLSELLNDNSGKFNKMWQEQRSIFLNKEFVDIIDEDVNSKNTIKGTIIIKNGIKTENRHTAEVYKELLYKSTGKVFYLDIWTTGCKPCREAMPRMKLNEDILKKENIEIVTICVNTDQSDNTQNRKIWKGLIEKNPIEGQHYFLSKSESEMFLRKIPISYFPQYKLLKNGVIVNSQMPSPHDVDGILKAVKTSK